jgi:hypothetical protein
LEGSPEPLEHASFIVDLGIDTRGTREWSMNVFYLFMAKTSQSIQNTILYTCLVHFLGNFVHKYVFTLEGGSHEPFKPSCHPRSHHVTIIDIFIDVVGWRRI